jgi:hypothetical protein
MKIAVRVFVIVAVLIAGTCANAAQTSFTGPGPRPEPPVAVNS